MYKVKHFLDLREHLAFNNVALFEAVGINEGYDHKSQDHRLPYCTSKNIMASQNTLETVDVIVMRYFPPLVTNGCCFLQFGNKKGQVKLLVLHEPVNFEQGP